MRFRNKILLVLIAWICISSTGKDFFKYMLPGIDNKLFYFSRFVGNKATVIVILLSDCPASQSYTLTLNELSEKYSDKGIGLVGIFPGKFSTEKELNDFKNEYKINFPLLMDPSMSFSMKLTASIAPSCFLIDKEGNTVYKGRIDDWLYAVGKNKPGVTQHNLEDAIKSVINNEPIKIKETTAIGCILEYGQ